MFDGSTFPKPFKWLNRYAYYDAGLIHDKDMFRGVGRLIAWFRYSFNIIVFTFKMAQNVVRLFSKKKYSYSTKMTLWVIATTITFPLVIVGLGIYDLSPPKLRTYFKSLT